MKRRPSQPSHFPLANFPLVSIINRLHHLSSHLLFVSIDSSTLRPSATYFSYVRDGNNEYLRCGSFKKKNIILSIVQRIHRADKNNLEIRFTRPSAREKESMKSEQSNQTKRAFYTDFVSSLPWLNISFMKFSVVAR